MAPPIPSKWLCFSFKNNLRFKRNCTSSGENFSIQCFGMTDFLERKGIPPVNPISELSHTSYDCVTSEELDTLKFDSKFAIWA